LNPYCKFGLKKLMFDGTLRYSKSLWTLAKEHDLALFSFLFRSKDLVLEFDPYCKLSATWSGCLEILK
jgi:hypothetical protein